MCSQLGVVFAIYVCTDYGAGFDVGGAQDAAQSAVAHGDGWRQCQLFPNRHIGWSACGRHRGRFCRRPGGGTWRAGNADSKGSPIIHTFTKKNESFTLSDGRKMVGDAGECLLLLWRYFHRTPEDLFGGPHLQTMAGPVAGQDARRERILVVNSSELCAVQGHQKDDFVLRSINPPKLREKTARAGIRGSRH